MTSRARLALLALAVGAAPGCTTPVPFALDAGESDAGAGIDAAAPPDTGLLDATAAMPDVGPLADTAAPSDTGATDDAGSDAGSPDAPSGVACDALFADPAFTICATAPTTCNVYVNDPSQDCRSICTAAGGNCRQALRTDLVTMCGATNSQACGAAADPAVCICEF